ncbi:hypothetical protein COY27_06880 [Candidatus Woesearchaeota archaeon CG_4_10_14_0_2_um_filter_33_13]|nr:MAG: hypothetical protein COY27_06880 [Candidatus Woesearchaeota archaeon CG_4_10_14_0_2_um_filter_33_13]
MLKDYFKLAYGNAKHRKLRSWLTMLGIFIGIAAVVSLISLSQGMQNAIGEQFVKLGSDKLIVQAAGSGFGPPGTDVVEPLTTDDWKAINKINGVEISVGRLIRSAKLEFKSEVLYSYIASMPDSADNRLRDLVMEVNDYQIEEGRLLKNGDKYKVMIGSDFNVDVFDKPVELRSKIKIQDQQFEVVGILKKSGNPFQDGTIVVPESALKEVLGIGEEYDMIGVKVTSEEELPMIEERVNKELRRRRDVDKGKEDFTVQTPGKVIETLTTILVIVQGILVGIAGISLFVGGIGIMNTMYTAVIQRTKEIGIMKAIGARRESILLLFLIESGMLGFFGGVIGVTLGFVIGKFVEYVGYQIYGSYLIRADFSFMLIFSMLMFGFLIGAMSGWFPAKQAAKLNPVEALRK